MGSFFRGTTFFKEPCACATSSYFAPRQSRPYSSRVRWVAQTSLANTVAIPVGTYQEIFVTATSVVSTSTTIADYNSFVTSQASQDSSLPGASMGVTWTAVASTASVAADVNAPSGSYPVFNTAGQVVSVGNSIYGGTLANAVGYDQNGNATTATPYTGSNANGTADTGFTLGSGGGIIVGNAASTSGTWISNGIGGSSEPLYALSSPVTNDLGIGDGGTANVGGSFVSFAGVTTAGIFSGNFYEPTSTSAAPVGDRHDSHQCDQLFGARRADAGVGTGVHGHEHQREHGDVAFRSVIDQPEPVVRFDHRALHGRRLAGAEYPDDQSEQRHDTVPDDQFFAVHAGGDNAGTVVAGAVGLRSPGHRGGSTTKGQSRSRADAAGAIARGGPFAESPVAHASAVRQPGAEGEDFTAPDGGRISPQRAQRTQRGLKKGFTIRGIHLGPSLRKFCLPRIFPSALSAVK